MAQQEGVNINYQIIRIISWQLHSKSGGQIITCFHSKCH